MRAGSCRSSANFPTGGGIIHAVLGPQTAWGPDGRALRPGPDRSQLQGGRGRTRASRTRSRPDGSSGCSPRRRPAMRSVVLRRLLLRTTKDHCGDEWNNLLARALRRAARPQRGLPPGPGPPRDQGACAWSPDGRGRNEERYCAGNYRLQRSLAAALLARLRVAWPMVRRGARHRYRPTCVSRSVDGTRVGEQAGSAGTGRFARFPRPVLNPLDTTIRRIVRTSEVGITAL